MSILLEKEQLKEELFVHPYFFEHYATGRGYIYSEYRINFIKEYFDRFRDVPMLAIENFVPYVLLRSLCNDLNLETHSQIVAEIQTFIDADVNGFFLQPEGRTNIYRGEFSISFYRAVKENNHKEMVEILKKAEYTEHMFDKKF